jgi:thiamine biosynthesis lipoprotein
MDRPQHHPSPQPSRRQFLTGRAAADALANLGSGEKFKKTESCADSGFHVSHSEFALLSITRRLMACDFVVDFPAQPEDDSTEHALAALDLIESLEDQMTVYRDDSEVIRINRTAADGPVPVEPRLFTLLQLAEQICRDTNGASDPTSGPLSAAWGFSRREGRVPSDAEIAEALAHVGFDHVTLDASAGTIAFDRPGVEINLNSIGKGHALDRAAELLEETGTHNFLIHGGKSSVLARGGPDAFDENGSSDGWTIGIRHPLRPAQRLGEIRLQNEALATSGAATQSFRHQGRRYGHILDPRTGQPAEGVFTVTVVAPTAAEADALSTAFYVMHPDEVAAYCDQHPDIRAVIVRPGAREGEIVVDEYPSPSPM